MDLADHYRIIQIELLSRSDNCSAGSQWIWEHFAQCLEEKEHVTGFVCGCLAIVLCAFFYSSLSVVHVHRSNQTHRGSVLLSAILTWLSEVIALSGAIISLQLPTQILYSMVLIPVHTVCCAYVCLSSSTKRNKTLCTVKPTRKKSVLKKCMYPFYILLPAIFTILLVTKAIPAVSRRYDFNSVQSVPIYQTVMSVFWLVGYIFGTMAGILLCCSRVVEMIHVFRSMDNNRCLPYIYLSSIAGGLCYIYGILSQSLSILFIYHTLPWTLPRLVAVGMDFGILIQRMIYTKQGRKRKISNEDAKSLLSTEEDTDYTDNESEEVLWMPLKIMDNGGPVSNARVQLVSPTELNTEIADFNDMHNEELYRESDINRDGNDDSVNIGSYQCQAGNKHEAKNSAISSSDVKRRSEHITVESQNHDIHSDIDKESFESSSSESNDSENPVTNNTIIKENIDTLTEVSKEEKITSWINTSK